MQNWIRVTVLWLLTISVAVLAIKGLGYALGTAGTVLVVTVLVATGLVYVARMLWMLGRRAAELQGSIEAVKALRHNIESLSDPQLPGSAKLISMEVVDLIAKLKEAHIPLGLLD